MRKRLIRNGKEIDIFTLSQSEANNIKPDCIIGHSKPNGYNKGAIAWKCCRCDYIHSEIYDKINPPFTKYNECEYCGKRFDTMLMCED